MQYLSPARHEGLPPARHEGLPRSDELWAVCPEIILNKIYYYTWLIKQRELCQEIKKSIYIEPDESVYVTTKKGKNDFNWRKLDACCYTNIYNIKSRFSTSSLPINY
jgi:hypothetical protein